MSVYHTRALWQNESTYCRYFDNTKYAPLHVLWQLLWTTVLIGGSQCQCVNSYHELIHPGTSKYACNIRLIVSLASVADTGACALVRADQNHAIWAINDSSSNHPFPLPFLLLGLDVKNVQKRIKNAKKRKKRIKIKKRLKTLDKNRSSPILASYPPHCAAGDSGV